MTEQKRKNTRKKKLGNFEILVNDIVEGLDALVPKGMKAVEVIGALEVAKIIVANRLAKATLIEDILNDKD
jgi:hypothetical protein